MENTNEEQKTNINYSKDLSGKLLFMRHGRTAFNIDKKKDSRRTNENYVDCRLDSYGIFQARFKQSKLNSLSLEKVYVSPFYRALETLTYSLENHPNKKNIIALVHPLVSEISNCINDYILDIKKTKNDFNMNSKIKIDWSFFDEYVNGIKYDENFYYFENFDCLEENEKNEIYQKVKNFYDNKNFKELKIGLSELAKLRIQRNKRFESLKHLQERFKKFCEYIREQHKETLLNTKEKILVISHSSFMQVGTDMTPYESEDIQDFHKSCYNPGNCQILSYKLD